MRYAVMTTPIGPITVGCTNKGLAAVQFGNQVPREGTLDEQANRMYTEQLNEYFNGSRVHFDLPLDLAGTPFQLAVWRELLNIPYGQTRSYGEIAKTLGKPGAARAVGMANHENRIPIVVPCHRVVGQDGSLTGYASGLRLKQQLLSLETGQLLFT